LRAPSLSLELLRANAQEKGKNGAKTGQANYQKTLAKAPPLPTFEAFVMLQLFEITRVGRQPELPQQRLEDYDFVIFTDGGVRPTTFGGTHKTTYLQTDDLQRATRRRKMRDIFSDEWSWYGASMPTKLPTYKQTTFKERRGEERCGTYFSFLEENFAISTHTQHKWGFG